MPIRPEDVPEEKLVAIPKEVFDAFDRLIALHYSNGRAVVRQSELVILITELLHTTDWPTQYLNIEEAYRAVGWVVEYDKPAYCESYPATFTFKKKER